MNREWRLRQNITSARLCWAAQQVERQRKELLDTHRPASLECTVVIKKLCFKYGRRVEKAHPRMLLIPTHNQALA